MTFLELSKHLAIYRKENKPITSSFWPSEIYLDQNTLSKLRELDKYTNSESMFGSRNTGPVGWEYGFKVFYFVDALYLSKIVPGSYGSVSINMPAIANPIPEDNKSLRFELKIGDTIYKTKKYDSTNIKKNYLFAPVAVFHSHPKNYYNRSNFQYSFFSSTDINTLIFGSNMIVGLVTGNKVWLAVRTSIASEIPYNLLAEASRAELRGSDNLKSYVKNHLNTFGIIFYEGTFGSKLRRI